MVNSLKRAESRMAFGSNLVKPSELFGSVKRTINRNRQSRCQCKHHQQKLLAKQEEQRQQLQDQLRSQGCQSFLKWHLKLLCNFDLVTLNLCFVHHIFSSFGFWYFGILVTFDFLSIFFCLAHLALQNVNKSDQKRNLG